MKLSPWIEVKIKINGKEIIVGSTRIRVDGNVDNIDDRFAFVEKTPRIRIRPNERYGWEDFLNWAERPFKGDGPMDQESRDWCDAALIIFGHELL